MQRFYGMSHHPGVLRVDISHFVLMNRIPINRPIIQFHVFLSNIIQAYINLMLCINEHLYKLS